MPDLPITVDKQSALDAALLLLQSARGGITNEEAAAALDALVDSGPWDGVDDPLFVGFVDAVDALVPDDFSLWHAFDRDPAAMRERARQLEAEGNPVRAARVRARADKAEARQSSGG